MRTKFITPFILAGYMAVLASCYNSCNQQTEPDPTECQVQMSWQYLGEDTDAGDTEGYRFQFKHTMQFFDHEPGVTWFFGDGAQSVADNPIHTYRDCLVFDVELTADDGVCYATDVDSLDVSAYANCKDLPGTFALTVQVRSSLSSADLVWGKGVSPYKVFYRVSPNGTWLAPEESGGTVTMDPPNLVAGNTANINPPAGVWEAKVRDSSGTYTNVVTFTTTS